MQLATWQTIEGADQKLYTLDDDHARTRLAKKMKNTKKHFEETDMQPDQITTTHKYRE